MRRYTDVYPIDGNTSVIYSISNVFNFSSPGLTSSVYAEQCSKPGRSRSFGG